MPENFDIDRMRRLMDAIEYKDWTIELNRDRLRGGAPYLRWTFTARDAKTGESKPQQGRKWYLSGYMTDSEIVLTAFKAALTCEEHECRESFGFLGRRILNPHIDVWALHSIANIEDVRTTTGLHPGDNGSLPLFLRKQAE